MKLEDVAFKLAMRARTEDNLCLSAARVLQTEILTALREERERCAKIAAGMAIPGHAVQGPSCLEIARLIRESE